GGRVSGRHPAGTVDRREPGAGAPPLCVRRPAVRSGGRARACPPLDHRVRDPGQRRRRPCGGAVGRKHPEARRGTRDGAGRSHPGRRARSHESDPGPRRPRDVLRTKSCRRVRAGRRRRAADLGGPRRVAPALRTDRGDVSRPDPGHSLARRLRRIPDRCAHGGDAVTPRGLSREGLTYLFAIAVAAAVSALFIVAMRGNVSIAFQTIFVSSLGSLGGIAQTLNKLCPILLGSTAVMLAYRGGFFNIGVDGQIYVGAIVTTGIAFLVAGWNLPSVLLLPAVLAGGLLGGAMYGAV